MHPNSRPRISRQTQDLLSQRKRLIAAIKAIDQDLKAEEDWQAMPRRIVRQVPDKSNKMFTVTEYTGPHPDDKHPLYINLKEAGEALRNEK